MYMGGVWGLQERATKVTSALTSPNMNKLQRFLLRVIGGSCIVTKHMQGCGSQLSSPAPILKPYQGLDVEDVDM